MCLQPDLHNDRLQTFFIVTIITTIFTGIAMFWNAVCTNSTILWSQSKCNYHVEFKAVNPNPVWASSSPFESWNVAFVLKIFFAISTTGYLGNKGWWMSINVNIGMRIRILGILGRGFEWIWGWTLPLKLPIASSVPSSPCLTTSDRVTDKVSFFMQFHATRICNKKVKWTLRQPSFGLINSSSI